MRIIDKLFGKPELPPCLRHLPPLMHPERLMHNEQRDCEPVYIDWRKMQERAIRAERAQEAFIRHRLPAPRREPKTDA